MRSAVSAFDGPRAVTAEIRQQMNGHTVYAQKGMTKNTYSHKASKSTCAKRTIRQQAGWFSPEVTGKTR